MNRFGYKDRVDREITLRKKISTRKYKQGRLKHEENRYLKKEMSRLFNRSFRSGSRAALFWECERRMMRTIALTETLKGTQNALEAQS